MTKPWGIENLITTRKTRAKTRTRFLALGDLSGFNNKLTILDNYLGSRHNYTVSQKKEHITFSTIT